MESGEEGDDFLPDLPNEKSGEQIVFKQKVFWSNEAFKRVHQNIINWFLLPQENCVYLKSARNNKNGFRVKCKNYIYDESNSILHERVKCVDGIGELIKNL